MAAPPSVKNCRSVTSAMERTGQWVFSQEIPTDVVVQVGDASFSLHKFMLVAKSNYIRNLIMESKEPDLAKIDLSDIPGGPSIFEKAAKFCYGVNFEITVHNVAALRCAADYLQMTDKYCDNNLSGRTEDFMTQVALASLSGAIVVLRSCQDLLLLSDDDDDDVGLNLLVKRCVEVASSKACIEANFPSRSPPNWWTDELSILDVSLFGKILASMKSRGAKPLTLASAIITYSERSLRDLVRDQSGGRGGNIKFKDDRDDLDDDGGDSSSSSSSSSRIIRQRQLLESIVGLLPTEKAVFPINFLCCLLRSAIFLKTSTTCKNELEKRISAILEHVTVDDLLVLSFTYDGERLFDLDSVRKILSGFVENEKSMAVFNGGDFSEVVSTAMQRVGKTVDAYLGEIATFGELGISKFNGIANLVPKGARKVDDDLYRAVDIYLKAHPNLDEIEREKACSVMDPLKLSYEARVHASQNKRLPVQIVLHALYYDQLMLRSGVDDHHHRGGNNNNNDVSEALQTRNQLQADVSLMKENEALRTELMKMKMHMSDMQKKTTSNHHQGTSSSSSSKNNMISSSSAAGSNSRKPTTFFSSVSKTLGKFNPFKHAGSKDTSNLVDDSFHAVTTKPRKRRFSIS